MIENGGLRKHCKGFVVEAFEFVCSPLRPLLYLCLLFSSKIKHKAWFHLWPMNVVKHGYETWVSVKLTANPSL